MNDDEFEQQFREENVQHIPKNVKKNEKLKKLELTHKLFCNISFEIIKPSIYNI